VISFSLSFCKLSAIVVALAITIAIGYSEAQRRSILVYWWCERSEHPPSLR